MQYRRLGAIGFHRSDELVLNLLLDCFEPPLGVSGATLKMFHLALKLGYLLLGGPQLDCQLVRHTHGPVDVLIRDARGFPKHGDDSVPRLVDRRTSISRLSA